MSVRVRQTYINRHGSAARNHFNYRLEVVDHDANCDGAHDRRVSLHCAHDNYYLTTVTGKHYVYTKLKIKKTEHVANAW